MRNAKTIQIFLPDGNPRGVRIAEITSRTVQVCLIPRASLDSALKRGELAAPGLYMLFGSSEDDGKTHVKYLESIAIDAAKQANRYRLENGQGSTKPHVRESDEADIWDFFETAQLLVSTLGYPIFDEVAKAGTQKRELLYCKGKDANATGEYTEDGLVVLSGSVCRSELVKSAGAWVAAHRSRLLEQGTLLKEGDGLRLTENFAFPSPSAAAAVVLGRPANGWIEWKYDNGKTLDEVKR